MIRAANAMREAMRNGRCALGLGAGLVTTPTLPLLAAENEYEWLFIDLEHSPLSIAAAANLANGASSLGVTPIVRLCKSSIHEASRLLDNGVQGIVMPHVDTAAEAAILVDLCKYAPLGKRSWGGPSPQLGFPQAPSEALMSRANAGTLAIAMIESVEGFANLEQIVATPGLDGIFVGAIDLSIEMGAMGDVTDSKTVAAVRKIAEIVKAAKLHIGLGGVFGPKAIDLYRPMGFDFILAGIDYRLLAAAIAERASSWKALLQSP